MVKRFEYGNLFETVADLENTVTQHCRTVFLQLRLLLHLLILYD